MGTIAEKLQAALNSKNAIKQALTDRGMEPTDVFSTYSDLMSNLDSIKFKDNTYGTIYRIDDKDNPLAMTEFSIAPVSGLPGPPRKLATVALQSTLNMAFNIAVDSSGNYVVCYINYMSDYSIVVSKLNSTSGSVIWSQTLAGVAGDYDNMAICVDPNDNIYVGYRSVNTSTGGNESVGISKIDSNGAIQWERTINTTDYPVMSDTEMYATSSVVFLSAGIYVVKATSSGTLSIIYTITSNYINYFMLGEDECLYIGMQNVSGTGVSSVLIKKLSASGSELWSINPPGRIVYFASGASNLYFSCYNASTSAYEVCKVPYSGGNYSKLPISTSAVFMVDATEKNIYILTSRMDKKRISDGASVWEDALYIASGADNGKMEMGADDNIYVIGYDYDEVVIVGESTISGYEITATCIPFE